MKNRTTILLIILIAVIATACAPAETEVDLPTEAVTADEPAEMESAASTPTLTMTLEAAAEATEPLATPSITIELMPESPTKPAIVKETPVMPDMPTAEPPADPRLQELIDKAKRDLAQRLNIAQEEIVLVEFRLVTWPDASLGCPEPGMAYKQVPEDGYLIMLRADLGIYNYHGGGYPDRGPFLCEGIGSKIIVPPPARSVDE